MNHLHIINKDTCAHVGYVDMNFKPVQFANSLGRRRGLLVTAGFFALAPVVTALASSYEVLLLGRSLSLHSRS